jgi:hypothetical protein
VLVQLLGEKLDVKVAGSARLDQGVDQLPGLAGVEEAEEGASNHAGSPIEGGGIDARMPESARLETRCFTA